MKKLMVILIVALTLVGCGVKENKKEPVESEAGVDAEIGDVETTAGLTDSEKDLLSSSYKDLDTSGRTEFATILEKVSKMTDKDQEEYRANIERLEVERDEWIEQNKKVIVKDDKLDMQKESESNASTYPASAGKVLYNNATNSNFRGMNYYFEGKVVRITTIENIGDTNVWLVKNENGYVMPIQYDRFNATEGDTVEVWGTLSGNGYANAEGIDNVVGQTGSMHAIMANVNGEKQY